MLESLVKEKLLPPAELKKMQVRIAISDPLAFEF